MISLRLCTLSRSITPISRARSQANNKLLLGLVIVSLLCSTIGAPTQELDIVHTLRDESALVVAAVSALRQIILVVAHEE
jgi:hypothetical protein